MGLRFQTDLTAARKGKVDVRENLQQGKTNSLIRNDHSLLLREGVWTKPFGFDSEATKSPERTRSGRRLRAAPLRGEPRSGD